MAFKAPAQRVSDPSCQINWEAVQSDSVATRAAEDALSEGLADTQSRLAVLGTVQQQSSTAAQGPGAVGADVVYGAISVSLVPGTWLVYGQASLKTNVVDYKQLALWDGTAEIVDSASAVDANAAAGVEVPFATTAVITVTSTTTVWLLAKRGGASQISVGAGGPLVTEQRITAVRLT